MRQRATFLVFGSPSIEQAEIDEVVATLRSGWLGTGPKTAEFERRFARYAGAPYAVAVNSCTAALHLSLLAMDVGPGRGVITSPLTFAATASVILHTGARPFFVDVDRQTMNISPVRIREFLEGQCDRDARSGRARHRGTGDEIAAIVPVHFAGRPCDMDAIEAIAREYGLRIIEDAAHAIEGVYHGRKIGSIGDLTCFSFYVTKNLTTGEGGMITTCDERLANHLKTAALHGLSRDAWKRYSDAEVRHYEVVTPGYKYNMTDIQASLGLHQLSRVAEYHQRRVAVWETYDRELSGLPLTLPAPPEPNTTHARHLYTVLVDRQTAGMTRDEFRQRLHACNVGTGVHFVSLHLHDFYCRTFGFTPDDFPEAAFLSERTVSLPLSAKLSDADVGDVIGAVRHVLRPPG
jgi:dTDP-4-amino-4,6-dideoxygalactose transaminase